MILLFVAIFGRQNILSDRMEPSYCIGIEIEITININFYVGHNILFYYGPLDAM